MISESLTCNKCKHSFLKSDLKRNCSNCFTCTGCEIYLCNYCGEKIILKPLKSKK